MNKIFSYGNAIVRHLMNGGKIVGELIYEARATICRRCPSNIENVCQECGCKLEGDSAFVSKLLMPTEQCPINKWCAYNHDGTPIIDKDPKLYQINTMLKMDGEHVNIHLESIIDSVNGKIKLNKDPLDNTEYLKVVSGGFFQDSNRPHEESNTKKKSSDESKGGCGCNGIKSENLPKKEDT